MGDIVLTLGIRQHEDVVLARQRARQLSGLLGFPDQDQTRIATAVSEIVRNAFRYAGGGRVEFEIEGKSAPQVLIVRIEDRGAGIPNLPLVLSGRYQSTTGLGLGLAGAKRIVDQLDVETKPGKGTTVVLKKVFPRRANVVTRAMQAKIAEALALEPAANPMDELQQQNRELVRTLDELRARQEELTELNRELEDTNRGVVALYAELDEKADHLRRVDEMKSRFLSNMSHEFRTPLHSIMALTRLLLDRVDGDLTPEQDRQVGYIKHAAEGLLEIVNDLLDIAKIEAGKIDVHPVEFDVMTHFSALRGMLRPLLASDRVRLVFDDVSQLPTMYTDESKVSQILRNFISNALKFTEAGEVRVHAGLSGDGQSIVFAVSDTGIGIAPADQVRIFEEFTQIEGPLQNKAKGTGLGLPLTRRLAELLGGSVDVESAPGQGSTFRATIPVVLTTKETATAPLPEQPTAPSDDRLPVLVIEDQPEMLHIYERYLHGTRFQPIPARSLREAREAMARFRPRAVVLDIVLKGEEAWDWLARLKASEATRNIPVIVVSTVDEQRKGITLGADTYIVKPIERERLILELSTLVEKAERSRLLIVDDEEASRYLLRKLVASHWSDVREASDGEEGLRLARELLPSAIVLDLQLPGLSGEQVLEALSEDPSTRGIPVVVVTSQVPIEPVRKRLQSKARAVLSKHRLSADSLLSGLRA